MTFKIRTFCWT